MIDKEIHAVVVADGGKATGVVSQTDLVLVSPGPQSRGSTGLVGRRHHDPGCATRDATCS